MTVISGFTYSYDKVQIKNGDLLSFDCGIPLPGGDGALAYVDITGSNGVQNRVFKADLLPADENGIKWRSFLVPLNNYSDQQVNITFGVGSPSGNLNADWVAFGNPFYSHPNQLHPLITELIGKLARYRYPLF